MSPSGRRCRRPGRAPVPDVARLVLALSLQRLYAVRTKSTHGHNLQLVQMALRPGEEIGEEVREDRDQFFRVEADDAVIVWQGARYNVRCVGKEPLELYTIYGPPEHVDGTVHRTRTEAEASHEHFDRKTTERRRPRVGTWRKKGARIVLAPIARRHLAPGSKARQRALAGRRAAG